MVSFEAFFFGESIQESGGSYSAVGPQLSSGRAYGKYQIMDFNIPSWTREALGHSLTPQEFLNNPQAQEDTARAKFLQYFNAYGPRGAAAMWYSGNPNLSESTAPQGDAGPSIKDYVDGVLAHAAGYNGPQSTGVGGAGNDPGLPGAGAATQNVTPHLSMQDLQERYGFTASMLNADKSLKSLFNKAVQNQYTDSRFQAELMGTTWWRSQTDVGRQYWLKKFTDPATATAQYSSHQAEVNTIAGDFGISMFTSAAQRKLIDRATDAVLNKGWNESQIRNFFASNVGSIKEGQEYGGKLGQFQDQIVQSGFKNGIRTPAADISAYVKKLALGTLSMEQVQHDIRMKAAHTFTAYAPQLKAGEDMMDLASPYIKSMSQILEMSDAKIDLFDPLIRNNLQWKDPSASGKAPAATPLWQFEQTVRQDPRWQKTNNARDSVMTDAHKVLTDFGVAY